MLVTNNLYKFNTTTSNQYRQKPRNNNLYYKSGTSEPAFTGVGNFWGNIIKKLTPTKKTPLQKAADYIKKGSNLSIKQTVKYIQTGYKLGQNSRNKAGEQYQKAITILEKNWATLDEQGQKQFVTAYFCMSGSTAAYSVPKALGITKELYTKLTEKSPLIKEKDTLETFLINTYILGKIAILNGNLNNAKECFEFAQKIALQAEANGIKLSGSKKEDAVTYFTRKLKALEELNG